MEIRWRVVQFETAAMVLHDLLDDSEAKPGPLLARRHIGLEQPLAIFARQPLAVVDNVDPYGAILASGLNPDCAVRTVLRIKSVDRLGTRYSTIFLSAAQTFPNLNIIYSTTIEGTPDSQSSVSVDGVHGNLLQDVSGAMTAFSSVDSQDPL